MLTGTRDMQASRPSLNRALSVNDFQSYYWLKEELTAFCREQGISGAGSKLEVSRRIEEYLATGSISDNHIERKAVSRARSTAPPRLDAPIGTGYTSSEANRAFFKTVIGPQFHFTTRLMKYCRENPGKTWGDAVREWQAEREEKTTCISSRPIAAQFEYNRFVREYFVTHPGGALADAIKAWNEHKKQRR
jgi:hypothetical protein